MNHCLCPSLVPSKQSKLEHSLHGHGADPYWTPIFLDVVQHTCITLPIYAYTPSNKALLALLHTVLTDQGVYPPTCYQSGRQQRAYNKPISQIRVDGLEDMLSPEEFDTFACHLIFFQKQAEADVGRAASVPSYWRCLVCAIMEYQVVGVSICDVVLHASLASSLYLTRC